MGQQAENNEISAFCSSNTAPWCVFTCPQKSRYLIDKPCFFPLLLISVVFPANGSGALSCPYQQALAARLNHRCQEIRPVEKDTVSPSRHVQGAVISAGDQGECNLFDGFVFLLSFFFGSAEMAPGNTTGVITKKREGARKQFQSSLLVLLLNSQVDTDLPEMALRCCSDVWVCQSGAFLRLYTERKNYFLSACTQEHTREQYTT